MGFNLPVLNRRRRLLGTATPIFSPSTLFALNEPGVWYDPSDVANLAWRRNLLTFTEQFDNAVWAKSGVNVPTTNATSPIDTATADLLVPTAVNTVHTVSQTITTPASSVMFSFYAKSSGYNFIQLHDGTSSTDYINFNVSTGAVGNSSGYTGAVVSVGSGWYLCSAVKTFTSAAHEFRLNPLDANTASRRPSFLGDGTSGILIWGAQLELGSVATDYQRISDVNTEVIERFPSATLFQDTAGTLPVTTPGQTVALALDKSKGLVLGSELDDGLSTVANWTVFGTNVVAQDGDAIKITYTTSQSPQGAYQQLRQTKGLTTDLTVGKWYRVAGQAKVNSGSANIQVSTASTFNGPTITSTSFVDFSFYFLCDNATTNYLSGNNLSAGEELWIRAISVRELPGFHATQATLASRPTYGIVPLGGRRNLLTRTEEFGDAVWTKNRSTVTALGGGEFTLTQNATDFAGNINQTASITASQLFSVSVEAKAGTAGFLVIREQLLDGTANNTYFNLSGGTVGTTDPGHTAAITSLGDGWYRCSITATSDATARTSLVYFGIAFADNSGASSVSDNGKTISLRKTQYAFGALSAYQRVGSAFDVTEAGVASLSYLSFDGVDDFMVTPTITPGIDRAQVFAGVRHSNTAATGAFIETSTDAGSGAGSLAVYANTTSYSWRAGGTTRVTASGNVTPPITNVLTGIGDISGDIATLRLNGTQAAQTTTDQGTGNYLAYPLYIGRRAGTSLPFNGQLYSLIVRFGTNLDDGTITSTETWVNSKTGAYA